MVWLEFVGPAGVGKTYFFGKLMQKFPTLHPDRVLADRILASGDVRNFSFKGRIGARIRQLGIKNVLLDRMVIAAARRRFNFVYTQAERDLADAFFRGLPQYDSDAIARLRLSAFYLEKMEQHKLMAHYLGPKDLFLSEDGLIHLNFGLEATNGGLLPQAVILLDADDNYILKNRLGRQNSQQANRNEQLKTAEELEAYVLSYNRAYRNKAAFLKQTGIRIYEINVQEADAVDQLASIISDWAQIKNITNEY